MVNIESRQEFNVDHSSNDFASAPHGHNCKNEESALSPQEVAAKIWDQWMQCRSLSIQLNTYLEFKINNPD